MATSPDWIGKNLAQQGLRLGLTGPQPTGSKLNLTIKNKQETDYVKHSTNWETNLNSADFQSKAFFNDFAAHSISFTAADFSEHALDFDKNPFVIKEQKYLEQFKPILNRRLTSSNMSTNTFLYKFESEWTPNDIALLDDLAIVATQDYCSTDKTTWVLDSTKVSPIMYHYGIVNISPTAKCNPLPSTQLFGVVPPNANNHTYQIWMQYGPLQVGEEVTITAFDCSGNPDTQTINLPSVPSYGDHVVATVDSCSTVSAPTSDWSSYYTIDLGPAGSDPTPEPPPSVDLPTGDNIDLTTPPVIVPPINQIEDLGINLNPLDTIVNETIYDCYLDRTKTTFSGYSGQTNFYLPLQIGNIYFYQTEKSYEVVDLSDTFIEINYSSTDQNAVIQSGNERIVYKFGGYCIDTVITPNVNKLRYQNEIVPGKNLIDYEDDYFYYPIFDTSKKQIVGVLLSSNTFFKLPENREDWNFKGGYVFGGNVRLHGKDIPITSIQVHKITNHPHCGKVDIYFRKTGKVNGFSYGTVVSNKHGLQNNDIIKFTSALNINVELAVLQENGILIYEETEAAYLMMEKINKSLSDIRYVKVIDDNRFQLYEDPELTKIITVPFEIAFTSDIQWSCIGNTRNVDNQAWKYYSTLYSPHGKNGYGVIATKRELVENQKFKDLTYNHATTKNPKELIDYADLHTYTLEEGLTPYLNYKRSNSWNNHYPFKRTTDEGAPHYPSNLEVFDMAIKNGNRFGSALDLLKVTNTEYILLVGEKGATESYKILNQYALETDVASWIPFNSRVTPTFLPYGRIHLFKITKDSNSRISSIDYLRTVDAEDNPWKAYEVANQLYRQGKVPNNRTYSNVNYGVLKGNILTFNNDASDYWNGARYLHWNKQYTTDVFFASIPKLEGNESEFGFIDAFGKSLAGNIKNLSISSLDGPYTKSIFNFNLSELNLVVGAESKNTLNSDLRLLFRTLKIPIYNNIYTSDIKEIYVPVTLSVDQQKVEAKDFANKISFKNNYVVLGWPSRYKSTDNYIYVYKFDTDYTLNQTITRTPTGFGDFFAFDGTYIVTNGQETTGDNGQTYTFYGTDYLYIYYRNVEGNFQYIQKLSPTIDISNERYTNTIYFPYTFESNNLSYQGTRANSRTYITKLLKRYDIYNGVLVMRDPLEYCVFTYRKSQNKFIPLFTNFVDIDSSELGYYRRIMSPNDNLLLYDGMYNTTRTSNCIVKLSKSSAPATFSTAGTYDSSQFNPSYQIFEFSQLYNEPSVRFGYRSGDDSLKVVFKNPTYTKFNVGTSIDFQNPNYGLPLFIHSNEIKNNNLNLLNTGYATSKSGIPMYLKLLIEKTNSGIPLFVKQVDIAKSGLNLSMAGNLSATGGIPLYVDTTVRLNNQALNLVIYNPIATTGQDGYIPLTLRNVYQNGLPGYDPDDPGNNDNWTIGTRTATGVNLYLKGDPYIDFAKKVNLFIGDPANPQSPATSISGDEYGSLSLSIAGPVLPENIVHGTDKVQPMNLFLKANAGGSHLNLFVYNSMATRSLNMKTNGAYIRSSGLNLFIEGLTIPSGSFTLYTRGFQVYG